jgi:hypothetical protein
MNSERQTITTSIPLSGSLESRRITMTGVSGRRLYVRSVRGSTMVLARPSTVDWMLGRVFGWWR